MFSPTGEPVAAYRTLFPWQPFERSVPGDQPAPVLGIPGKGTREMNRLLEHFERAPRAVFEPYRRLLDRPH